ncbi:hypothetical protein Q1695_001839 [Nippostrongylus brasiliensis]|nr:hypothetical protein Q1695_001839 [Nippostrongylus brasiliensis]
MTPESTAEPDISRQRSAAVQVVVGCLQNEMGLPATEYKAFVVDVDAYGEFLLIVEKKWVLGLFDTCQHPSVGSIIKIVDSFRDPDRANKLVVRRYWNVDDYVPMGGFSWSRGSVGTEFTGNFYTAGCVCYDGALLKDPVIFNDTIGIVLDKGKILRRDYIGKLKASVTFVKSHDGVYWNLRKVVQYCNEEIKSCACMQEHTGVVYVPKNRQSTYYIISRDFAEDILLFAKNERDAKKYKELNGCKVSFPVHREFWDLKPKYVADGVLERLKTDFRTILDGHFFLIDVIVEHLGCTDEKGRHIVWSEELEFVYDHFERFSSCRYGYYRVRVKRKPPHSEPFPKWFVSDIVEFVAPLSKRTPASRQPATRNEDKEHVDRCRGREEVKDSDQGSDENLRLCRSKFDDMAIRTEAGVPFEKESSKKLRLLIHKCLESDEVKLAVKKANPKFYERLVKEVMSV